MKRMACVLALATGTGLALGATARPALAAPNPATAASGLQVDIATTSTASNDATLNLDVKFRGGNLRAIELYVDGMLIKRQNLRTRKGHGTIRFALDSALLANGYHDVKVVATDVDGNTATATSQWNLVPGDQNDPVRFLYPQIHNMVQGVVPIEVKLAESLHKPYVLFFVDHDFLALINYAPYTYNWDSTRVPNGVHTLGVEAYDGDTLAKVTAHRMQIVVNNPGGLTTRQNEIKDLGAEHPTRPTPSVPAESGSPAASLGVKGEMSGPMALLPNPHGLLGLHDAQPLHGAYSTRSLPHIAGTLRTAAPRAGLPGAMSLRPPAPGPMALLAGPRDLVALNVPTFGALAHQAVHPLRAGNIAARPAGGLHAVAPVAPNGHGKIALRGFGTSKSQVGSGSLLRLRGSTFDVAFDDTRITFDVPPRVERGLPLAPFRQIFEHTGGTVAWFGKSKMVRAVNATREIEIKIGDRNARVNNQPLKMEAKPYIDRGRTIVPLSFVRDALDVTVQYDPQTGHMRIESQK